MNLKSSRRTFASSCRCTCSDVFISFLCVWKLGKGEAGETERHKDRSVFAGLCNCPDLIGGERKKTISLSHSSAAGNRKRGEEKIRTLDRGREATPGEGERDS